MKMWPSSRTTGEGEITCLSMQVSSHSTVPTLSFSAEMPTILPHSAQYTYCFFPLRVIGVMDEWDIWRPFVLGVFQTMFPLSRSTPIIRISFPTGARTAVLPSMIGHCAAYQSGGFEP